MTTTKELPQGTKGSVEVVLIGHLPEEASARTRSAQEKQTTTTTERITRFIER